MIVKDVEIFVIDASLAVKWFFREPESEQALRFLERFHLGEIRIVVPEMFYLETANACWKSIRRREIPVEVGMSYLDDLLDLSLETYSDRELSDVALENSLRFNISVYDGAYLALAEVYVAPLVTADRALFNTCKNRFDFIEFLGDLKVN